MLGKARALALTIVLSPACGRFGFELLPQDHAGGPADAASPPDGLLDGGSAPNDAGGGLLGDAGAPLHEGGAPVGEPQDAAADVGLAMPDGGDGGLDLTPAPPVTANLIMWLDASDLASLEQAQGVTTWRDLSGHGHDAAQLALQRQPMHVEGVQTGRSVVRFDGEDDYLELANDGSFDSADLTVLVLVSPRWTQHPGDNPSPFAIRAESLTTRVSLHLDGNKANMHSWTDQGQAFADYNFVANGFYLLEFVWASGAESHYVNGTFIDTDARNVSTNQLNRPVRIGAAEADVENWPGDIAELFVYDRALSPEERVALEDYVAAKWGPLP